MSDVLVTVEEAAERLKLHPKTVIRHIRSGRLPARRIGKSYRIEQAKLDAFAGIADGRADPAVEARATCVVDVPRLSADAAERISTLLMAAAMTGNGKTPPLHLTTAFDPHGECLKVVMVGSPADAAGLLEMLRLSLESQR